MLSAFLAGALAWVWRSKAAGILLGILILTKEDMDLMIIGLYQPVTWAGLGLWAGNRAHNASSPRAT
jgi:hypothetical protein